MDVNLDIQREVDGLPKDQDLIKWVTEVLTFEGKDNSELTIRFVSVEESAELNNQYRNKPSSTNILSFPFEVPDEVELNLLGDLVVCSDIVKKEALEQKKEELAHWAHMVVHGTLHLLGYDHLTDDDANIMESKEIKILSQLGYADPYTEVMK